MDFETLESRRPLEVVREFRRPACHQYRPLTRPQIVHQHAESTDVEVLTRVPVEDIVDRQNIGHRRSIGLGKVVDRVLQLIRVEPPDPRALLHQFRCDIQQHDALARPRTPRQP